MHKSVGIFGGGIAGMSAAHELAIAGYDVTIYESSDSLGGMAKSYRQPNGLPTEYSWRGYGQFYKNVFHIMSQIPSPTRQSKSVYDTELSRPVKFILTKDDVTNTNDAYDWTNNFTLRDWSIVLLQMIREMASDTRVNYYATINAMDYLKQKVDPRNLSFITSIFGPWLGIDPRRTSLHHLANFFRMIQYPDLDKPYLHDADEDGPAWEHGSGSQWLVLKRPSSESWFDPWTKMLITYYHVKIHLNHTLDKFIFRNNKIVSAQVISNKISKIVQHDYYILATTPFAVKDIVIKSGPVAQADPQLKLFHGLTMDGPHIQVSFRLGFKEKIHTPEKYMAFIFPDSEFNITCYFQDAIWYKDVNLGLDNKTLISGTACISYLPGKLFQKPITELTEDEFKQEIWYQMTRCNNFNHIIAENNNGRILQDFPINVFEVWKGWNFYPNFSFDEKKWVNSTHTNPYMPEIKTSFPNLFLAGAHVKSSVDLYSMETACATGRDAAFMIINDNQHALRVDKPIWMATLGKIDNALYAANLPNIIDVIIFLVVCIILYYLVKK